MSMACSPDMQIPNCFQQEELTALDFPGLSGIRTGPVLLTSNEGSAFPWQIEAA